MRNHTLDKNNILQNKRWILVLIVFCSVINCEKKASLEEGRFIFQKYCTVCHGQTGEGNGPLAASKNPRPADLTKSGLTDLEKVSIIKYGGASVGRSPEMPAWGEELREIDIENVILFVNSIRKTHD